MAELTLEPAETVRADTFASPRYWTLTAWDPTARRGAVTDALPLLAAVSVTLLL